MTSMPLIACGFSVASLLCSVRTACRQRVVHLVVTVAMLVMMLDGDDVRAWVAVLGLCLVVLAADDPWRGGWAPWHPAACAAGMAAVDFAMMIGSASRVPAETVLAVFTVVAGLQLGHVLRLRRPLALMTGPLVGSPAGSLIGSLAGSLAMVAMCVGMLCPG